MRAGSGAPARWCAPSPGLPPRSRWTMARRKLVGLGTAAVFGSVAMHAAFEVAAILSATVAGSPQAASDALEEQGGVGAAESERARDRGAEIGRRGGFENDVQLAGRIDLAAVRVRRQPLLLQREHRHHRLERARGAQQ